MSVTQCTKRNVAVDVATTPLTTTPIKIAAQDKGDRMLLLLTATAACTVTVAAGNAEVFGNLGDLAITFSAAGSKAVCLDTARYKFVSGENKGCILVKASKTETAVASMLISC